MLLTSFLSSFTVSGEENEREDQQGDEEDVEEEVDGDDAYEGKDDVVGLADKGGDNQSEYTYWAGRKEQY